MNYSYDRRRVVAEDETAALLRDPTTRRGLFSKKVRDA
jgi:hypothetical protein